MELPEDNVGFQNPLNSNPYVLVEVNNDAEGGVGAAFRSRMELVLDGVRKTLQLDYIDDKTKQENMFRLDELNLSMNAAVTGASNTNDDLIMQQMKSQNPRA